MNQQAQTNAAQDEVSFADLFRGIWSARVWALAGLVIGLAVAVAAVALNFALMRDTKSFKQEIAFTVGDTYPNGTRFSINDLRAPVVLHRVYDELGLEGYGLSFGEFSSLVSITPSSGTYEAVTERYRARLEDKTLTYAERQQIENEFSVALSASISSGATVSMLMPEEVTLPNNVGLSIVSALPRVWADIYINQLGVLDFPVPYTTAELLSADLLESLDYPVAYNAIGAAFASARDRVRIMKSISGTQNLADPETGRTLFDIEREINNLYQFSYDNVLAPLTELGLSRSPELTLASYQYQIDDLERRIGLAKENARIIGAILGGADIDTAIAGTSLGNDAVAMQAPGTIVQQFGPELVDRLVTMSVENAGVAFREKLLLEKQQYESDAIRLTSEQSRIKQRAALIRGDNQIANAALLQQTFDAEAAKLSEALNGQWRQIDRILEQANIQRLSYDKELYRFLPTPKAAESSKSLVSRNNLLLVGGLGILGLLLGFFAFFLKRITAPPRTFEAQVA